MVGSLSDGGVSCPTALVAYTVTRSITTVLLIYSILVQIEGRSGRVQEKDARSASTQGLPRTTARIRHSSQVIDNYLQYPSLIYRTLVRCRAINYFHRPDYTKLYNLLNEVMEEGEYRCEDQRSIINKSSLIAEWAIRGIGRGRRL